MKDIKMVDLLGQYKKIEPEIDQKIKEIILSTAFIKGQEVDSFERELADYLNVKHVISCGNGTDALQIALMGLELNPGDEVITVDFTFAATVEVIKLLGLTPVIIGVEPTTMTMAIDQLESAITPKTKAIVPVHLFGQTADIESIMSVANKYNLYVIEDNAQALGADYIYKNGQTAKAGTIGSIGTTSFFPSKNLGAYGDGGAVFTNDDVLAKQMRSIANHGMSKRYFYERIGINSRLDTLQAGILSIKLKHLDDYKYKRQKVAEYYDKALSSISAIEIPTRAKYSSHVFHQYTIKVRGNLRDDLKTHLEQYKIPSMIYYPVPLHQQKAYEDSVFDSKTLKSTVALCNAVLSLPIHTEMDTEQLAYITQTIKNFFK